MKKLLLIMSILFASSCSAASDQPLSGEHLNGIKYKVYSGPAEMHGAYLDKVVEALEKYSKGNTDDVLKKAINQSREKAWTRVDFEYLEPGASKDASAKIKVGVRYQKGELQCVVYENQILVAFNVVESERRSNKMYYVSVEKELHVTHAYSF